MFDKMDFLRKFTFLKDKTGSHFIGNKLYVGQPAKLTPRLLHPHHTCRETYKTHISRPRARMDSRFFFLKDMGAVDGVGGVVFLLATGEILNTTDEVERISKTHFLKEVSEVVLGLQNCSVAFMDAKNGFLTKFHIEMVVQKKYQLFCSLKNNIF